MPKFLFSYRLPEDYQRSSETAKASQAWFQSLGTSLTDRGRVLATQAMGNLDADTRLGGYSVVTAEDLDGAAALAERCPALRFSGGVEIGTVLEYTEAGSGP
jgi:hypothetical protein